MALEFLSYILIKDRYPKKKDTKQKYIVNSPKTLPPKNRSYDDLIKYHSLIL